MKELTFKERFALIALNGLDPERCTTAKKVALRSIIAAGILEKILSGESDFAALKNELEGVRRISVRKLKTEEKQIVSQLSEKKLIKTIPNLLCCDMMYATGGVSIFEYQCDSEEYSSSVEYIRTELLEDGKVSDEIVCLWWLLKESSCFYDLFSKEETKRIEERLCEVYLNSKLAKNLFATDIQNKAEITAYKLLQKKKEFFSAKLAVGFLFIFPFIERSEAIFIDMEKWFSDSDARLEAVLNRLVSKGLSADVVRRGSGAVLKINNIYYQCVSAVTGVKIPIQGIRLVRYSLLTK